MLVHHVVCCELACSEVVCKNIYVDDCIDDGYLLPYSLIIFILFSCDFSLKPLSIMHQTSNCYYSILLVKFAVPRSLTINSVHFFSFLSSRLIITVHG
jgi:hypothetical protein